MQTPNVNGNGKAGKFGDFVEENFASAYRFAFCLSLAHDRATRLVETTFHEADLVQKSDAHAAVDKTWLLEALHRKWMACHPRLATAEKSGDEISINEALISLEGIDDLECDVVLKVLHSMSPVHRLLLSLFYFEQLGYREIARIVDLPPETVLGRLASSKILLRQMLGRLGAGPRAEQKGSEVPADGLG